VENFTFLGNGLGTADFLFKKIPEQLKKEGLTSVEHEYLRVLSSGGAVGIVLYLLVVGFLIHYLSAYYQKGLKFPQKQVMIVVLLWIFQYLLNGFIHRSFPMYPTSVLLGVFLGYLVKYQRMTGKPENGWDPGSGGQ
jgi:hypothetical protein